MKRVGEFAALLALPLLAAVLAAWMASGRLWVFRELPVPDPEAGLHQAVALVTERWADLTNQLGKEADRPRIADSLLGHELGEKPDLSILQSIKENLPGCSWLGLFTADGTIVMERGEPVGLAGDPGRGIPQIPDRVGLWASIAEDGSCLVTQTGHNRFGRVIGCLSVGYPSFSGLLGGLPGLRPVLYRNKLILVQADDPLPETLLENIAGAQLAAGTALSRDGYRISAIRLSGWTAELAVIVADPGWFERVSWIVLPAGAAALAVALLVLLVMALLARARRRRLEKIQDELDRLGGVGEQTATGVEALIRHAEMLERRDSPEGVEPDTVPVLAAVLGRDAAAPVPGTPPRPHDQELDVLINRVIGMDEPGTGADAGDDSGEREPGILGVEGLAGYWEMMRPIVRDTLRVGRCLLLSPDPAGTFRVVERVNTDPRLDAAFVIRPSDGLFQRILGKKKVLFLKERVMESRVIAALLPGEDAESVHQMAIIPVVAQDGGIGGMLVMLKSVGEVPFDVYALYETMYLSIL